MIALDADTKVLQVVLSGAKTTNDAQCFCVFHDVLRQSKPTFEDYQRATRSQDTNGGTAVTACAAPNAGVTRMIEHFSLYNYDTANITATVQIYDSSGATTTTRLKKVTLGTGTGLVYESGTGWLTL